MTGQDINIPSVVAEVRAAFEAYEAALLANRLVALDRAFWDAEATVRYGVAENLYGADAIARYRRQCDPVPADRRLLNTVITTYGTEAATVSTQFRNGDRQQLGRQMQTWIRFEDGWKVVAAHVSVDLATLGGAPD